MGGGGGDFSPKHYNSPPPPPPTSPKHFLLQYITIASCLKPTNFKTQMLGYKASEQNYPPPPPQSSRWNPECIHINDTMLHHVLVVELNPLELFGFHDAAASIGISQVPQPNNPVCSPRQDHGVVIKHTRCQSSHTLLLERLFMHVCVWL